VHSGMYDRLLAHFIPSHLLCESLDGSEEASFIRIKSMPNTGALWTYLSTPSRTAAPGSRPSQTHRALLGW
jgi:hypothetical protein